MDHNDFIENALKTESVVDELKIDHALLLSAIRLYIQSTEILDVIKKVSFYNNQKKMELLPSLIESAKENASDVEYNFNNLESNNFEAEYPVGVNTRIAHGIIGICTEGGELAECLLDHLSGGELDHVNMAEEMFDGDWYKAIISDEADINWENEWQKIIDKLRARFGDKFSEERANVRDLETERKILER